MNTVLVHFWLLQSIYSDEELLNYWQEQLEETLTQCGNNTTSLILDVTPELIDMKYQSNNLQNFVNQIKIVNPQLKIFLIFNKAMVEQTELSFNNVDDIICIDYYLLIVYNRMLSAGINNKQWNLDNDKILFLNRRPFDIHRVGLLRRLIDLGMKNDLKWSLPDIATAQNIFGMTVNRIVEQFLLFLPNMTNQEAKNFIEKNSKTIDNKFNNQIDRKKLIADSEELYSSVLGEIVSDTQYLIPTPIFLTEKIFKPIANHIPFIYVGQPDAEKYLKNMGFHTFSINNTISMSDQKIEKLLENGPVSDIFFTTSFHADRFKDFYKDFKDPSWPADIEWNTINKLPVKFQVEVIESFFTATEIKQMIRLHETIQRIVCFKEMLVNNKEEVNARVEHNVKRFNELGEQNMSAIKQFLIKNNIELDIPNFFELFTSPASDKVLKTRPKLYDYSN